MSNKPPRKISSNSKPKLCVHYAVLISVDRHYTFVDVPVWFGWLVKPILLTSAERGHTKNPLSTKW